MPRSVPLCHRAKNNADLIEVKDTTEDKIYALFQNFILLISIETIESNIT